MAAGSWRKMFVSGVVRLLVGAVALLGGATTSFAALKFDVERIEGGAAFILVSGEFDLRDDLSAFEALVRSSSARAVTFHSPGGNVVKAMELGRLIRRLDLMTIQLRATECSSACSLAFFGGTIRQADPGAIGVHKSSFSRDFPINTEDAVSAVQQLTAEVVTYMIEMGVDPALLQVSLQYDSDDIRYLSLSEMEKYRIVTNGRDGLPQGSQPRQESSSAALPPPAPSAPSLSSRSYVDLSIPQARTGRIRRPQGTAPLMDLPDTGSRKIAEIRNGFKVLIVATTGRWYRVRAGEYVGYLHDTWVHVDQFENGPFAHRHVQVKSFDNFPETESYIRSSPIPLTAYLATNGWFAITLADTFPPEVAKRLVKELKQNGAIPEDSYMTFGNTYVRKVCCQ